MRKSFVASAGKEGERTRLERVVKQTVSLTRAKSLHEARHDHTKVPLNRLWVSARAHGRPGNDLAPPGRRACTVRRPLDLQLANRYREFV